MTRRQSRLGISLVAALAELVALVVAGEALAQGTWATKASSSTARRVPAVAAVNGILYVAGGALPGSSASITTVEVYDPLTDSWALAPPMPTATQQAAAGAINGTLYVVGGGTCCGGLATLQAFDTSTNTWSSKASMSTPRYMLAAGVLNNILYAAGGRDNFPGALYANLEAYNPTTNSWTTKAPMLTGRSHLGIGVVNGTLFAVGGVDIDGNALAAVEAYDPVSNTWTAKASLPTPRYGLTVSVVEGILYAVGGVDTSGAPLTTVEAYDQATNTWTPRTSMPVARVYLGSDAVNGVVYVVGGLPSAGDAMTFPTVVAYTPPAPEVAFFDNMEGGTNGWTATGFWHQRTNPQTVSVDSVDDVDDGCDVGGSPNDITPDLVTLGGAVPTNPGGAHAVLLPAFSGTHIWWYGSADTLNRNGTYIDAGTFDPNLVAQFCKNGGTSSAPNSGTLTSPSITLSNLTTAMLRFKTWFEIESVQPHSYDQMIVEVLNQSGTLIGTLGSLNPTIDLNGPPDQALSSGGAIGAAPLWTERIFGLDVFLGQTIRLRFNFATGDVLYNGFRGWAIDDVTVSGTLAADVGVTMTVNGAAVRGGFLNYTITVTNAGPGPAAGVMMTDALTGLTLSFASPSQGSCTPPPTSLVTCTLGSLASGASATITLGVTVTTTASPVTNTAQVTSTTTDENAANDQATLTLPVLASGFIAGRVCSSAPCTSTSPNGIDGVMINAFVPPISYGTGGTTAGGGFYTLGPLPVGGSPGGALVQATKDGFATVWYQDKSDSSAANFVPISGGTTQANPSPNNVNFTLFAASGAPVSGMVTDTSGNGVGNVNVGFFNPSNSGNVLTVQTRDTDDPVDPTKKKGYYTSGARLPTGTFFVEASKPGYANQWYVNSLTSANATPVQVTPTPTTINITNFSNQVGTIRVTLRSGSPAGPVVPNVFVAAQDPNVPNGNNFVNGATTDANGVATIGQLLAGRSYVVNINTSGYVNTWYNGKSTFAAADPVPVNLNAVTDITMVLQPGGGITGRVTDTNGTAIVGAQVTFCEVTTFLCAGTQTVANGLFNPNRTLAPGTYRVQVRAVGFITIYWDGKTFSTADFVAVTAGVDTALSHDITLTAGTTISGFVKDPGGTPLSGAQIDIADARGRFLDTGGSFFTRADGSFDTEGRIPAGTGFKVRARLANRATTWYDGPAAGGSGTANGARTAAGATGVASPSATPLVIFMPAGVNITGVVTDTATPTAQPLANVQIDVFDANNTFIEGSFFTRADGTFDTQGRIFAGAPCPNPPSTLPCGSRVRARLPNYATRWSGNARFFNAASAVTAPSAIAIAMPNGVDIAGTLTAASPIRGVFVSFFDFATGNFVESGFVDPATGAYSAQGRLDPGDYRVQVGGGGFATIFWNGRFSSSTADKVTAPATGKDFQLLAGGAISGTITSAGGPVSGAIVDVFAATPPTFPFVASATTLSDGTYTTGTVLPPGNYKVRARVLVPSPLLHTFFVAAENAANHFFGLDAASGSTITLAEGQAAASVDIGLGTGATITGVVKDRATNQAIQGATVVASRVVGQSFSGNFTTTTNANGLYTIAGLRDGEWVVRVTPPAANPGASPPVPARILGYYSGDPDPSITSAAVDSASAKPIIVTNGAAYVSPVGTATCTVGTTCQPLVGADVYLTQGGGTIKGRITRSDGGPVPIGTGVSLNGPAPRYLQTNFVTSVGTTDANGSYTFIGVPPGEYVISAGPLAGTLMTWGRQAALVISTAKPVPVTDGAITDETITPDVNLVLQVTTTRKIEGTLRDTNGVPIPYGQVSVLNPFFQSGARFFSVRGDGSYMLDGLRPGRYLLRAVVDNPYQSIFVDGARVPSASVMIDVTNGDLSEQDFAVPTGGGVITGRITRSDTGAALGGAVLTVRNFFNGSAALGATSRADGTFQIRAVPPGSYKFRVAAPPSPTAPAGFTWRWFANAGAGAPFIDDASFMIVNAGQTVSGVNVTLAPGGGRITGFVKAQGSGAPVEAAAIDVREALSGASISTLGSDVNGYYEVPALADGSYRLRITANGTSPSWLNGKDTRETADVFTIKGGALQPNPPVLDAQLSTTFGTVTGQIFKSDGTPLANAGVVFYDAATFKFEEGDPALGTRDHFAGFVSGAGVTDAQGRYRMLSGLKAGTPDSPIMYIARAQALDYDTTQGAPVGYAPVFFGQVPVSSQAIDFPITVTAPTDPAAPPVNFTLFRTSDVTGTIAYAGSQTGPLRVGVFCDSRLTERVARFVVHTPAFGAGQAYAFAKPAPDTQGLMPSENACPATGGKYYVGAFLDVNGNNVADAAEPTGRLGGATPTALTVVEGQTGETATVAPITLTESTTTAGTKSFAKGVFQIVVPDGGTLGTLGDIEIDEVDANDVPTPALSPTGRIHLTLPMGLAFATLPSVSMGASWGLSIIESGSDAPRLENLVAGVWVAADPGELGQRFSFELTGAAPQFRGGGATMYVSSMLVQVPAGFVAKEAVSGIPVVVAIGSSVPNGFTPANVTNGTLLPPPLAPQFTGVSAATNAAADGATGFKVILTGFNFTQLGTLTPGDIFFGLDLATQDTKITVTDVKVDSDTQITVTIDVAADDAPGSRVIAITKSGLVLTATAQNGGVFSIDGLPTLDKAGTADVAGLGAGPVLTGVKNQTVYVLGTGFRSPTTSPSNLVVHFSGAGITVNAVAFNAPTRIDVNVDVAAACPPPPPPADQTCTDLTAREVTVLNPDGGIVALPAALAVALPPPDAPQTLNASRAGTSQTVSGPSLIAITPQAAYSDQTVTISGSGFSTKATGNTVTFTTAAGGTVTVSASPINSSSLSAVVPAQAGDGPVTVTTGTTPSTNSMNLTVSNPRLTGVSPLSVAQARTVTLALTGTKFQSGARMTVVGVATDVATTFISSTQLQATITVPLGATTGLHDVSVSNPNPDPAKPAPSGTTSTLAQAFEVTAGTPLTLTFALTGQGTIEIANYLPSVDGVSVTLDGTGKCTAKTVTPTSVLLTATVSGDAVPQSMRFTITPSAILGTATNEDCEIDPVTRLLTSTPTNDFTIGATAAGLTAPLSVTVNGNGSFQAVLSSWDWGGKVQIDVTGYSGANGSGGVLVTGTLRLPVDGDNDDLPDLYENNLVVSNGPLVDNSNAAGVNVLDPTKSDRDANGTSDRNDRFAKDGLTNFEKYRGVWMQGPANGASGALATHQRLGAGKRNLFVRGRGFGSDPNIYVAAGYCGVDASGNPAQDTTGFVAAYGCPAFQVGGAFAAIGVKVWDVAGSFAAGSVLPRKSYADPTRATLDMATLSLDAERCSGGEDCTNTGKTGIRQWQFPTLGLSSYGGSTAYGTALVFLKATRAYFTDRPYLHQENVAGSFLPLQNTGVAMLAPINMVCDQVAGGSDNGVPDTGECVETITITDQNNTTRTVTKLGGDVFTPGVFAQPNDGNGVNLGVSAMDVNNDRCVELPFATNPTTLTACDPTLASAPFPQATLQQVVRSVVTHELGHATGVNTHTSDADDIMYIYTTDWIRDGRFGTEAAALIQIHNKGVQ